ncbi:MAG: transposase, partial [Magnetococcales bacterium]|nr:transposase [Magnetococcales bacterium]
TEKQQLVVTVLEVVRIEDHIPFRYQWLLGRPPADRQALARAFVAKAVLNLPTTVMLIDRLDCDPCLRRICGWEMRQPATREKLQKTDCKNGRVKPGSPRHQNR